MTRIARENRNPPLAARARLDAKSLPEARPAQPTDNKSIADQKRDHFFGPGSAPTGGLPDATWIDGGKKPAKKPLLPAGGRVIAGDSFGADRINRKHQGGEMVGNREEQVSTTFRVDAETDGSTVVKTDRQKIAELRAEVDKLKAEVEKLKASQETTKQPNPESDDAPARPVTRQELAVQRKGLRGGHADGDDGRAETQQPSGGGPVRARGQDDRPERERSTGAINVNRVLQIDQLVNPVRT